MFCPQCGGEQASGNMRFCSRCGFPLGGVSALLEAGGGDNQPEQSVQRSLYRRIVSSMGAKVIFASVVSTPFAFMLALAVDSPGPMLAPLFLFVFGLAQVAYALLFGTMLVVEKRNLYESFDAPVIPRDLPPVREQYIPPGEAERIDTARMTPPASVTERTTNLLRREESPEVD